MFETLPYCNFAADALMTTTTLAELHLIITPLDYHLSNRLFELRVGGASPENFDGHLQNYELAHIPQINAADLAFALRDM